MLVGDESLLRLLWVSSKRSGSVCYLSHQAFRWQMASVGDADIQRLAVRVRSRRQQPRRLGLDPTVDRWQGAPSSWPEPFAVRFNRGRGMGCVRQDSISQRHLVITIVVCCLIGIFQVSGDIQRFRCFGFAKLLQRV
jgi:hypothetical protein